MAGSLPMVISDQKTLAIVTHIVSSQMKFLRMTVLDAAYVAHPERFVNHPPKPLALPTEVWINKPQNSENKTH
jgi:putative transposase